MGRSNILGVPKRKRRKKRTGKLAVTEVADKFSAVTTRNIYELKERFLPILN